MIDAVPDVLRAFGIEPVGLTALAGGTSGAVWKVEAAGRAYVLRRHGPPGQPPAHVASELAWLDALGRDPALPTPVPVRQANGGLAPVVEPGPDGRPLALWTLLRWVDGETLGRLPDERETGLIGSLLGALHERATGWTPPPGFARPAYDAAYFAGAAHELLARAGGRLDARARADAETALRRSTAVLARLGRDARQVGLIHADIHDGNVVYGGEPRRAGAIDFARFGVGCWALDLAMAMHYLPDDRHAPLVDAYAARFRLSPGARRALPGLRYLAAIDNMAILSAIPDEADDVAAELAMLTAQAARLAG